jgi:hypothetical protein
MIAYDPHGGELAQFAAALIDTIDKSGGKAALENMDAESSDAKKDGAKKG